LERFKLVSKPCANCGIEMVTKVYIDATDEELEEIKGQKICIMCKERSQDPRLVTVVCAYCSKGTFTITQITEPGQAPRNEVRCSNCGYNEQKLIQRQNFDS